MQHGLSLAQALGIEADPDLKALHEDTRLAAIIARRSSVLPKRKKAD
jgi:hypothetical protein